MDILEIKNVAYSYANSKEKVLSGVNQKFELGKFYAIVGKSGTGKSTLLSLLAGLDKPKTGKILFKNEDIQKKGYSNHRKNNISLVFQNYNLIDYLSPIENIRLVNKSADESILFELGLDKKQIKRNVMKLSGGQQQRVGIARAFMTNPDIILMDEPFSALDPITRSQLQDELINIQTQYKKTIIFVSHDMDEAVKIADKICIMGTGKVIQHDDPETILKNPANDFVSNFVGKNRIWSSPEYIKVKDIMLDNPITCSAEMSLFKCVRKMRHERVDSLLVIDRKGKFEGIITGKLIQKEKDHYKTVREILETPEFTTGPENSIIDVLKEVNENKLSSLPVVDENGILRGIITKTSLVTTLSQQFDITVN